MFPKTKLLAISPMIFNLKASYLEYMYKTVRDSVNSDLLKRSRSQIKVKRFGFSGAVFILSYSLEYLETLLEIIFTSEKTSLNIFLGIPVHKQTTLQA